MSEIPEIPGAGDVVTWFGYFTESISQGWVDALNEAITDANQISVISNRLNKAADIENQPQSIRNLIVHSRNTTSTFRVTSRHQTLYDDLPAIAHIGGHIISVYHRRPTESP